MIRTISFIGAFALVTLAFPSVVRAVDPPPDGGYANGNTAEGQDALFSLTTGTYNTAIGFDALFSNTTGTSNTGIGFDALYSNTKGFDNTGTGFDALASNTTGDANTANGFEALASNTTGDTNTADGLEALLSNTTGSNNTADGASALDSNTTGNGNTANGFEALLFNTTGSSNTAIGDSALAGNNGSSNIALGVEAGFFTTGDNNIDIGNVGIAGDSRIIRIGTAGTQTATFITGIREAPLAHGVALAVGITADGQLGVRASSARFKEAIKPMDRASEAILSLQPVTFRYKKDLDPEAIPQFGLVAEEVAKVDPDLVARDAEGKPYTVRYEEVNAMLLNEFLKEHRTVQELRSTVAKQEATAAQQQKEIQALIAALKVQAAQIQKVSDQLGAQVPASRVLAKN